jgi:protein-arginine kinase activator protein McsA
MKVPCIICLNKIEVNDSKIIATVCDNCLTDKNIEEVGKNFTLTKLKEVLKKAKDKPDITDFGEVV